MSARAFAISLRGPSRAVRISKIGVSPRFPVSFRFLKSTATQAGSVLSRAKGTKVSCSTSTNVFQQRWYSQQPNSEELPLPTVDYDYVKKVSNAISDKDVFIIDVREPDEIKEHGKIPKSINIPLGNIAAILSISAKEFKDAFKRDKPRENSELIFYCMIGKRSGRAQQDAAKLGFKNTKNYIGSWTDWAAKSQ